VTGIASEKVKNGLMNVFTVCPATPMPAAPSPRLSSGSAPEVKTSVKNGVCMTTATKSLSSGSAADVIENRPKKLLVEVMKSGSATSALVTWPATGLIAVDGVDNVWSNSRRAKASSVNNAGCCAGDVGALLANGDRTAPIKVATRRDSGSAGVALMTVDAGEGASAAAAAFEDVCGAVIAATAAGVAIADGMVDANDGTPSATTRMESRRLLSDVVGPAAVALVDARLGLVFTDKLPNPGRDVGLSRAPGVSDVAEVLAGAVEAGEVDDADGDESVVVLVCGLPPG
jgi:hypothetical protein